MNEVKAVVSRSRAKRFRRISDKALSSKKWNRLRLLRANSQGLLIEGLHQCVGLCNHDPLKHLDNIVGRTG